MSIHVSGIMISFKTMKENTKECPSCAMEIDSKAKICPICQYEFPRQASGTIWIAVLLIIVFVLMFIL